MEDCGYLVCGSVWRLLHLLARHSADVLAARLVNLFVIESINRPGVLRPALRRGFFMPNDLAQFAFCVTP